MWDSSGKGIYGNLSAYGLVNDQLQKYLQNWQEYQFLSWENFALGSQLTYICF